MRRLDGIYYLAINPVVRAQARRFGVFGIIVAILFGLISNASFPSTTLGEAGAANTARLWSSGAELNSLTPDMEITSSSGTTPTIDATTKRSGDFAYRANTSSNTATIYKTWATAAQTNKFWFRTYIYVATTPGSEIGILQIGNGSSAKIGVRLNSDRSIELWNEEDNTIIGSASSVLTAATWYRVEVFVDTSTAASTDATLLLDGTLVANSTAEPLTTGVERYSWGVLTSSTSDIYFDDIAINDSTGRADNWAGEGKIVHLQPDATGDNSAWTGTNTDVDEVTPNDNTDFLASSTATQIEDVNLESATSAGMTAGDFVKLVSVGQRYRRCNSGFACAPEGNDIHKLRVKAAASGTVEDVSIADAEVTNYQSQTTTATHLYQLTLYDLPGTSTVGWKTTDLDTTQLGVENVTVDQGTRISTLWLLVEYVPGSGGRLFSSGFELNSVTAGVEWPTVDSTPTISSTTIRSGTYSGRISSLGSGTRQAFGYSFKTANANGPFWLRTYFKATTLPSAENRIIDLRDSGGTARVYLTIDNIGVLKLYDEDGQLTGTSTLSTGTWYRLEVKVDASGAGANDTVEAKVDGAAAFASSAVRDLTNGITQFGLGGNLNSEAQTTGDWFYEDVAINENVGTTQNGYPGAGSIVHLKPNGNDATNTAWTNDYTNVDEVTPNDATDLISETTTGDIEDYSLEDAGVGSGTVNLISAGVRFNSVSATQEDFRVRIQDVSTGVAMESNLLSPASTTWVTNQTAAPYSYPITAYTRPDLATAWTDTELDTAQIGVRDLAGSGTAQVSTLWLLVDYIPGTITISGTCDQYDQSTDCADDGSNAIKLAVNGTLQAQTDATVDGAWSIASVTQPATGDIVTVFIDANADANEAVAVAKYDGTGDMTGIILFQRHLSIGSVDDQTLTNTNLSQYDNGVSGDEDIFFEVNATDDLTVDTLASYTDEELYIAAGDTFRPASAGGADVITVHVENDGTWTADSNAITVAGSWQNDGTFTGGTSTTTFSAVTTGFTLSGTMTGATGKFYALTFNGVGGGWTFSAAVETGETFTVTNGAVSGNAQTLTVAKDFTLSTPNASVGYTSGSNQTVTIGNDMSDAGPEGVWSSGSTVQMTGTFDGNSSFTNLTSSQTFVNLNVAYTGTTTTNANSVIRATGTITLKGGIWTASGGGRSESRMSTTSTPVVIDTGSSFTGTNTHYFITLAAGITITTPTANANFGTWTVDGFAATGNASIIKLGSNLTTTGSIVLESTITGAVLDTDTTSNYTITAGTLSVAPCTPSRTGDWTIYMRGGTHTFSNTTSGIILGNNCGAHTLDMGSSTVDVKGAVELEDGTSTITVTPGTGTLTWTHTSASKTFTPSGESFYNITLNGSGGTVAPSAAVIVTNDLTMTAGTLSSSTNVTVNGNVAGTAGIITLTGGTFEQRVASSKNFGTTSGSTAWTFFSLTFSNSSGSAVTITTQTGGSGGITVGAGAAVFTVGKSGDTATTTLDAGNRTWTLSGTGGNELRVNVDGNGSKITGSTSTFSYTGNALGNTTVEQNAFGSYYNLTFNAAETFVLEGATDIDNNLTITAGTLDTVSGSNHGLTIGNNYSNSGTFTARLGTVTFNAIDGSNTLGGTLSGTSSFYNLTFNGVGGTWSMSAASTITNNLVITNGTLDDNGSQITGNATGVFTMASGTTLKLGTGTATLFPATFTAVNTTLNAASTVIYNATVAQNISGTPTYGNLQLSAASGTPTKSLLAATVATGTVTIDASNTLDVDNTGNFGLTIGGSYVNNGTFTARVGTVTMNDTSGSKTLTGTMTGGSAFYNLTFNGVSGAWSFGSTAATTSNNFTITNGTVTGSSGIITIANNYSNAGAFTHNSGTVKMSAVDGANTLSGTMTGASSFYNLTFDGVAGAWSFGSDSATMANNLTITNGTVTGSSGTLTVANNYSNAGTFTHNSGTVKMSATDSGNTLSGTMTGGSAFYNLTFDGVSGAWSFGSTSATISNNFTITNGTVTGSSGTLTINGNYSNSGTFTNNSGTVTMSTATTQTLGGTMTSGSAFYNLILTNSAELAAPNCERTSFTASHDFNAAATISNLFTINSAAAVEFNNGSTYTVNNMSWNGGGSPIYFRSSVADSGTWLLNVTAVGNAQTKISNVDVSRSDASGGALIIASDGTNTDCGNNVNWQFDETLTLGLDSTSKTFGTIAPNSNPSDQTSTLTVTSNSHSGFTVYGWTTQAMTSNRASAETIADWTGTNASPTTFSAGSYGFGYTSDDTSIACDTDDVCLGGDRFTTATKYAGFGHTGPGKPVADRTTNVTAVSNTISYRLYPSATQADGDYSTVIVYVITANFP